MKMNDNHINFFDKRFLAKILIAVFMFAGGAAFAQEAEISDEEITNTVTNELMLQSDVPSYLIDVSTLDGIVTLSGTTDNLLAKDRAEKIAMTVRGVEGVINQVDVNAPPRSDDELAQDIRDALLYDPATDSYEVSVDVNNGVVELEGTVNSWQEKQLAGYVAKGVRGVKILENDIDVNFTADRSDFEIEKEVEQALHHDVRVDDALIEVDVNKGKVKLSGTIGSAAEKSQVVLDSWVSGVVAVNDEDLKVRYWARDENIRKDKYVQKSDQEIKEAIEDAFLYDPRVYSFKPNVKVDNGVVTLTGTVDNLKAKKAAENDAENVVGVFSVKNYINVRPANIPGDEELESDITAALIRNPYVDKYEIDVDVNNGVVTLKGDVDSHSEKYQAEDLAERTQGAVAVKNRINVNATADNVTYPNYYYYGWNSIYPSGYITVPNYYKSDWEIKQAVRSELWWSPYVNEDEVDITVNDSKVILTGTVDTEREKEYAEVNALEAGAMAVDNNLKVKYSPAE
jgi:osmotically-inducible protein OsmY